VDADDPTTWVRPTDANDDEDVNSGMFVLAVEGSTSGNVGFILITPDPITVDTTPLNFTRFSGAEAIDAGDNLQRTGSRLDVVGGSGSGLDADTVDGIQGSDISSIYASVTTETGAYTASDGDLVLADASTSAFSVILPSPEAGEIVSVKKTDSTTNPVTIATPASETIDGQSAISINTQFESRNVISDGSNYFVV